MVEKISILSGHSGCRIAKHESTSGSFVRKISPNIEYNKRLQAQIQKQFDYADSFFPSVKAPRIFRCGTDWGRFFADMEYIDGQTFAEYILTHDDALCLSIMQPILDTLSGGGSAVYDTAIAAKIRSLSAHIDKFGADSAFAKGIQLLSDCPIPVHHKCCHGDLTFENIMVSDGGSLYLIDFLDSFCDCVEVDAAKLLQDALCGWSWRTRVLDEDTKHRLSVLADAVIERYDSLYHNTDALYLMLILTLLRIYPYAKDEETVRFLDGAMRDVMRRVSITHD